MTILIQGAKAGQQQPKRPSIADDTIASISRLKMVIGLTEGEAKGLFNGAASIKLENTPLVDENANPNFEGVEWEIRHGTVDQTHIAGMPSASNEIGIGTTLFSGTPWVRSISDTQLSSINVNLSWAMLKSVTDKGDVEGTSVNYAIDVQTDGNGYVTLLNTSITAKTSGRYQRTHNIKLPDAQSSWQIRVRKITEDGNGETLFNAMQIDSIAEIIDAKLRYPHTALLYLSFDARTFSNIPKVSVHFQGVYVQVPTNYDPETRTSVGIWQGQFKLGYTTNPAWHYYNLITNDRYGLGDKLQPFMIDKWALEHIARICDEPVDDGKGGTEPRFECNLYLQKAEEAYQVLQHIAGIFRGMSFWNGSKIVVDADTPRDAEYVVTRANVINGKFSKSGSAGSDRHTIAQVAWSNPDNAYETEYAMVRNEKAIAQLGINTLDLSAIGCTSEGQAYRMGLAALLAEQNRTQTVSFAMGLDGSLPNVGSRIDIPDMMFAGVNNGGRISSVSDNRRVITIDRDNVPAVAGDKLIVNLESGKAQTRVITAINGRNITVALAFDPVAAENVWAVSSDDLPTMSFIVMSVTEVEDGTQYNYTAMQYDASMYEQIDNGTLIEPRPPTPSLNPYIIQAPESLSLSSRHRVTQGQTITTLVITWAQVKDAVAYDVEWRKDDGDWIKLSRTGNISAEVDGVYSGNYLARVRAVSAFDAISKPTTSTLTAIAGKVGKPPKLLSLKATGILLGMTIDWTFAPSSDDTAYTEIQVASAPDINVAPLGQFAYKTNTHTINGLQGGLTQYYRARIVDKLGNTSDWTNWVSGTTDTSADKIMDLIQGQIDESALDQALRSEIGKIDTNKTLLDNVSIDVSKAKADITAARNKADEAKTLADANKVDLVAVNKAVADNKTSVDQSITTLTNKDISLTNLYTALQSEYATNKAKVTQDITTLTDNATSLASQVNTLDSDYKGNKASVTNSLSTLTAKDTALTNSLNSLTSTVGGHTSSINDMRATIADNTQSIAQTKTELTTSFIAGGRNLLLGSDEYILTNSYQVSSYAMTDSPKDGDIVTVTIWGNLGSDRNNFILYNTLGSGGFGEVPYYSAHVYKKTFTWRAINGNTHLRIDQTPSSGSKNSYISKVQLEIGSIATTWSIAPEDTVDAISQNDARITAESTTRATADIALTSEITSLKSKTDNSNAEISAAKLAIVTANSSLAESKDTLKASYTASNYGKNLFNQSTSTRGSYLTTGNAGTGSSTHHVTSDYIPAIGETRYAFHTRDGYLYYPRIVAYDENKNYLAGDGLWFGNDYSVTSRGWVTPKGTKFLRVSAETRTGVDIDKWKLEVDNVTPYTPSESDSYAAIQENKAVTADAINGLLAQYTLKLDVGGRISGFGLASSATQSDFAINADKFWIAPPTGSSKGKSPFMVLTSPQTINGTVVPAGTYMDSAFIHKAAIDTAQIKDAAIKTANIDNLAVTSGKIANLAVDTLKIADYAVTIPRVQYTATEYSFNATETEFEINRLTLNAAGGTVGISFGFEKLTAGSFGSTGATVTIRIRRIGVSSALRTLVFPSKSVPTGDVRVSQVNGNSRYTLEYRQVLSYEYVSIPVYLDTPPSGDQTYIVTVEGSGVNEDFIGVSITARTLHLMGVKK